MLKGETQLSGEEINETKRGKRREKRGDGDNLHLCHKAGRATSGRSPSFSLAVRGTAHVPPIFRSPTGYATQSNARTEKYKRPTQGPYTPNTKPVLATQKETCTYTVIHPNACALSMFSRTFPIGTEEKRVHFCLFVCVGIPVLYR